MRSTALISLGANLPSALAVEGDNLRLAASRLQGAPDTEISAFSRFWKTPAHPAGSGPDYINCALSIQTRLGPHDVLALLHKIEAQFGRDRSKGRWSPRVLDLDLIGYEDQVLPDVATQTSWVELPLQHQLTDAPDELILPHPRLQDRGFVLAPLAEIAPDWIHPVNGLLVTEMLSALPETALANMKPLCLQEMLVYP